MLPLALHALAARQAGAFTAAQAHEHQFDAARHRRASRLVVVRKGVYACAELVAAMTPQKAAALHASARLLVSSGDLVASHRTAAAIHDFALLDPARSSRSSLKPGAAAAPA